MKFRRSIRYIHGAWCFLITRTSVHLSSYPDDALLGTIEAWADGVPALA